MENHGLADVNKKMTLSPLDRWTVERRETLSSNGSYGSFHDSDTSETDPLQMAGGMKTENFRLRRDYYLSTIIIYYSVLTSEMARGILFPTLWLYVSAMGGSKSFQGLVVSSFSMGRILSAPFFGYLSEIYGHQLVLILCNIVIIIGTLLYASASSVYWLIGGQFVIGFGAGR
jgi:Na+/melibiose symporter-like transporter